MKPLPLILLLLAAAAHAQDVTVTNPVWLRQDAPPDTLPARKHRTLPDYPREVKKSGEIGYVIIERHVNTEGRSFNYAMTGSQIILQRAVTDDYRILEMKPALNAGKPVDADVWFAFIFNPKSAESDRPNATPRLLDITPVWVSGREIAPIKDRPVIRARLEIDAAGSVSGVAVESPNDSAFQKAIEQAAVQWHFAPARQDGRPVAAEVSLPVVVAGRPGGEFAKGERTPPKVVRRVRPFYPREMRRSRLRGEVIVDFVVDAHGQVQNVTVKSSNNPGFEEEAINAIKKWKFEPALEDGKPVAAHMAVPIVFQFFANNRDAFTVQTGSQDELPPELRFDTPPRIRGTINPVYPYELLRNHVAGSATVTMLIDANGKVAKTRVVEASNPQFGLALTAAVEMYQFDPALRDGQPTNALLNREQSFSLVMGTPGTPGGSLGIGAGNLRLDAPEVPGGDVMGDYLLLRRLENHPDKFASARALDHPLRAVSRRPPVFPANLVGHLDHGTALIELVVDDEGLARIPRVISASDPAFGYAAVQAAEYWRFDPPTVAGKTVFTRIQVPFKFVVQKS